MAILLEGRLEFAWRNGLVHVSDESGTRLSISLPDFYVALADASELSQQIGDRPSAEVIAFDELRRCLGMLRDAEAVNEH
jgi:hypothetical protein